MLRRYRSRYWLFTLLFLALSLLPTHSALASEGSCPKSAKEAYIHMGKAINPLTGIVLMLTPVKATPGKPGTPAFLQVLAKNLTGKELALVEINLELLTNHGTVIESTISLDKGLPKNRNKDYRFAWPEPGQVPSIKRLSVACAKAFDSNAAKVDSEFNVFVMPTKNRARTYTKR